MKHGPTAHLTWDELACKDGTPYPEAWRVERALPLAMEFEIIRHLCGNRPIRILSAYRTAAHNRKVGGAPRSEHVEGRALDLKVPGGMRLGEFAAVINERSGHVDSWIGGIGIYDTFIHIDTRETENVVRWNGQRRFAEGPLKGEKNG